ncbi:MAG: hypothetical protein SGPRY_009426, partial [Prymnesium sp.]
MSKIAQLLRMQGEEGEGEVRRMLCHAIHLSPSLTHPWKLLGQTLCQDALPAPASIAFENAIALAPAREEAPARIALATALAQQGMVGQAIETLLTAEPLLRMANQLMPSMRFLLLHDKRRVAAWSHALRSLGANSHVFDISPTPLPALLASAVVGRVAHAGPLPLSITKAIMWGSRAEDRVLLLPAHDSNSHEQYLASESTGSEPSA